MPRTSARRAARVSSRQSQVRDRGILSKRLFWLISGGILLVLIGISYYIKPPQKLSESAREETSHSDLVSTFLLTLTNPTTVLSFLAVLAGLGMSQARASWVTLFLVLGIFCGSMQSTVT